MAAAWEDDISQLDPAFQNVIELRAHELATRPRALFKDLSEGDSIVVLRDVPEIHELSRTIHRLAVQFGGTDAEVEHMSQMGAAPSIETLAAFYRAFRHLRDSRHVSCLFADLIGMLGFPLPILVDTSFCRMVVPRLGELARERPDLFDSSEFDNGAPNEAEKMIQGASWGNAHRDIDVRHYHYQANFWFPLHDVDANRTLLLFPDVYRRPAPQYRALSDPDDPDQWGFGRALRVPLRLGDTLLFHSQQLHASPSQARDQDRFTVELRIAAGCIDDNARIYRRLFWNLGNFQPATSEPARAAVRAAQLAELPLGAPSTERARRGLTAHAVVHPLFRHGAATVAAGYIHRCDDVLDDVTVLPAGTWAEIIAKLESMPAGEDLWLMVARILERQKHRDLMAAALERILGTTKSYFWALEAGRVAADTRHYDVAAAAFDRASTLAAASDVKLDRYAAGMPPPLSSRVLQLLPVAAERAAPVFSRRIRLAGGVSLPRAATFDHRLFAAPERMALASFENYDLVSAGGLIVGLPVGRPLNPDRLVEDGSGVVVGETVTDVTAAAGERLGRRLPRPLPVQLGRLRPRNYWVALLMGRYIVAPVRAAVAMIRRLHQFALQ